MPRGPKGEKRPADVIGNPTIADAILDRLVHNAHRLTLKGESMRKTAARRAGLDTQPEA